MSFVHLHTHSHYSVLDGVPKIPELLAAVKERGMDTVAVTDHGNLYGAIEFYKAAKKAGIKPIIGVEAYVAPGSRHDRDPKSRPFHLILLAQNETGYQNLVKLLTLANLEGFYRKPRIDMEILREYREGLIALSGCLSGAVSRALLAGGVEKAIPVVKQYQEIFGDKFYLEVQHNPNLPEQQTVNAGMLELHQQLDVELVATGDVHYISPEDAEAQDVMVCIQTKHQLADTSRMSMANEDYSLGTPEQMQERFADFPGACDNTQKIANRINIELDLETIQLPHYDLPDGIGPDQALRDMCEEGMVELYPEATTEIRERLDYELDVIKTTGYAAYFLITADFIRWAKEQHVAVGPGRGSAAGSLVAYLTRITDVDPIHYELIFERFLNPERVSMPDIDTDFADARRDDVLQYVEEKYGKDHVAQIITFGTMAARASIRDVGRVLGLSYGYCDRVAKMIPMFTTLDEALATVPELKQLQQQDPDAERLISIARKLEGVVRHTSTHACAVVITKNPLDTQVPIQLDQDGKVITQYAMNDIEALGLLKMDFLGLKNLTIIENTLNLIEEARGEVIDIENLPLDDKPTFQLLKKANTIGVFQLESSGMRRYLKQLKPTEMEDIIAMVSLYRPGPMEFIPQYIDGKHGKVEIHYLDEALEPILSKTYGIAVYQEQIMEIARQLAGYSYAEADVLRKAVGKKIKKLLDEQEFKMIEGMVKKGISSHIAKQIWEFILPFARYGFNRSHAASYALIAYRTAFLKANYPAEFMAALMTSDYGNTERVALEVAHAQEMGITVLPPDVNESFGTFTVVKESVDTEEPRIRFGLKAIKGVGDNICNVIIAERESHGPFLSLENFLERVRDKDLNKKSLEALIKTGALDRFGDRSQLLWNLDALLQHAKRAQTESATGQNNLFGSLDEASQLKLKLETGPEADERQLLEWEKELIGLYISGHPMDEYRDILLEESIPFVELKEMKNRAKVEVIGMVESAKKIMTKAGEPMLFVNLADYTSEIEAIVFPRTYKDYSTYWDTGALVRVNGKISSSDGDKKIVVESVERFDPNAPEQASNTFVCITVPEQIKRSDFLEIKKVLEEHPGDHPAYLEAGPKQVDTKLLVAASVVTPLQSILGPDTVKLIMTKK